LPEKKQGEKSKSSFEDIIDCIGLPDIPNLEAMGFLNMTEKYGNYNKKYKASYGKMRIRSPYKDSWAGHWELAGWEMDKEMDISYWKSAFKEDIISNFENKLHYKVIGNKTFLRRDDVLPTFIEEHKKVDDSVIVLTEEGVESIRTFGIYALMDKISLNELYSLCDMAANSLKEYRGIFGRIGARPLVQTENGKISVPHNLRKDFLIFDPPKGTVLEPMEQSGIGCFSVGKVSDMFRGYHITDSIQTSSNYESIRGILKYMEKVKKGVIWGNLNDFDAKYGHYFDQQGWVKGLEEFDLQLKVLIDKMQKDDLLIICSDGHGCDCTYSGIHTYEYSPLIVYSHLLNSDYLGNENYLNDIAATIADNFELNYKCNGKSIV